MNSIFKEFENFSIDKKTLSAALGFEPRSFDRQLKDLGSNSSAIENVFFSTERFSNSSNIFYINLKFQKHVRNFFRNLQNTHDIFVNLLKCLLSSPKELKNYHKFLAMLIKILTLYKNSELSDAILCNHFKLFIISYYPLKSSNMSKLYETF